MWMLGKGSLPVDADFWDLCDHNVRSIEDLVNSGNLLNQRQCQDLSFKLSKTTLNIRELVFHSGASVVSLRPALENLHRYLEKAKVLVNDCGEKEWWAAAVFQGQNENAFREILLDVSLCYNAIYEQTEMYSQIEGLNAFPQDLRESSVFWPATDNDIHKDLQDLQKRLADLAIEPSSISIWNQFLSRTPGALKQDLARYLLVKLNYTSTQSQANNLDNCSAIFWLKENEPSGTWGNYRLLGAGAGSSGVCSTKWMGIPCAKKEFHEQASEKYFLKEAGILACLKHPCIVNFFCCGNGEERGDRFIAMELLEKSLAKLIEEQKDEYFSLPVVVEIMVQIARGMRYLHDQGVAHRDLKPQNVVVNRLTSPHISDHFCVKLVDFGMSKTKVETSKSNTMTAVGIGTTMYRAPEVHPDANPDGKGKVNWFKADVFSFAMTCTHLLSLKRPFGDMERLRGLYTELINGRRPELPSTYPEELVAILRDCWGINPRSRPSFVDICTRLEMFRYVTMMGFSIVDQAFRREERNYNRGSDFIKSVICLKPMDQRKSSKRERNVKVEDAEASPLKRWRGVEPEHIITKVDKNGGLEDVTGVESLVQLMRQDQSDGSKKNVADVTARRTKLVNLIAGTEKEENLNCFLHLGGLQVLDKWLQEAHKGQVGDAGSRSEVDKGVEEMLLGLLRALDRLPVDLKALKTCVVGKSVNQLRNHKNREINRKARELIEVWKKRVDSEMMLLPQRRVM